jgi:hypothetical protein
MTRSVPEADDSGAQLGKGQQEEMRVKGGPQSITSQISISVGGAKREAMFLVAWPESLWAGGVARAG